MAPTQNLIQCCLWIRLSDSAWKSESVILSQKGYDSMLSPIQNLFQCRHPHKIRFSAVSTCKIYSSTVPPAESVLVMSPTQNLILNWLQHRIRFWAVSDTESDSYIAVSHTLSDSELFPTKSPILCCLPPIIGFWADINIHRVRFWAVSHTQSDSLPIQS